MVAEEGEMGPCQAWAVGEEGVMGMSVAKSVNSDSYFSLTMRWGMTSSWVKPLIGEEGGEAGAGGEGEGGGEMSRSPLQGRAG